MHTQTIEGFFGNVKNGIAGNYHGVSVKWLQGYLNEYTWRYNHGPGAGDVSAITRRKGRGRSDSSRGFAALRGSASTSLRFGTGICAPLGVVCCFGFLATVGATATNS